jgi:hypothetical protein
MTPSLNDEIRTKSQMPAIRRHYRSHPAVEPPFRDTTKGSKCCAAHSSGPGQSGHIVCGAGRAAFGRHGGSARLVTPGGDDDIDRAFAEFLPARSGGGVGSDHGRRFRDLAVVGQRPPCRHREPRPPTPGSFDLVIRICRSAWVPQLVERSRCLDACLGAGIGLSACWEPCV